MTSFEYLTDGEVVDADGVPGWFGSYHHCSCKVKPVSDLHRVFVSVNLR